MLKKPVRPILRILLPALAVSIVAALVLVAYAPTSDGPASVFSSQSKRSSMTLTVTSTDHLVGHYIRLSGQLSDSKDPENASVVVHVLLPDGSDAYPGPGLVVNASSGSFQIEHLATMVGEHEFTAAYGSGRDLLTAICTVTVAANASEGTGNSPDAKRSTSIVLAPVTTTIVAGRTMQVNGTLTGNGPIAGATISLKVTMPDGHEAFPAQGNSTTTDGHGRFTANVTTSSAGVYSITASYAGSAVNLSSIKTATFSASAPSAPIVYKYVITSNGGIYLAKNAHGTTIASGTNAASVINAALSSLTSGRTSKEKVVIQTSATLTSRISMPSYAVLECSPGVVLTGSGTTQLVGSSGTHDWEVIGGEWVCTDRTVTSASAPMYFDRPLNCLVSGSKVRDSMWNNIILDNARYTTIYNVESYRSWTLDPYNTEASGWHAIIFEGSANYCVVDSCYLHDNGHGGCYFYSNEDGQTGQLNDNVMRNNRVERCGTSGLSISQRSTAAEGHRNLIENNTLVDCGLDTDHPFINVGWNPGYPAYYNIVRNNTIVDNGVRGPTGTGADQGIFVSGDHTEVYGNDISGCSASILLDGNTGLSVHDNYIHDAPGDTAIYGTAYDSSIVNNTCRNMRSSVQVSGTGNTIRDNTVVP
jgi:hypothetical protein